jgi:hypothetical protein
VTTPDALADPPRKTSWKRWIIATACVLAAATIAYLTPPKPGPVKVWFVGTTNEFGTNKLVFTGTNGVKGGIEIYACVVTGAVDLATAKRRKLLAYDEIFFGVPAAQTNEFALNAPPKGVPYGVAWNFAERRTGSTPSADFRVWLSQSLHAHHMRVLGERVNIWSAYQWIPSTEIKDKPSSR